MTRAVWVALAGLLLVLARGARADDGKGYAVVATAGATDLAWPLAGKVYTSPWLKPASIDDATARVLAGEEAKTASLQELAELAGAVKGDDAASREVLAALASRLHVRGVVVVFADPPSARVFDAPTKAFDAARYVPDKGWEATVQSLERPYLPMTVVVQAPPKVERTEKSESKAFYQQPWFWVAVGTALLAGAGALIATSVQTSDSIHLQLRTF